MKYAGIGSRETPAPIIYKMGQIAGALSKHGFILRSGGAQGADLAFETEHWARKEIYRPADAVNNWHWFPFAQRFHPAWSKLHPFHKELHARNGPIIMGPHLDDPVDFVVCWTKDGGATGGTGQAIRIANCYGIPVFNLKFDETASSLEAWIRKRVYGD